MTISVHGFPRLNKAWSDLKWQNTAHAAISATNIYYVLLGTYAFLNLYVKAIWGGVEKAIAYIVYRIYARCPVDYCPV